LVDRETAAWHVENFAWLLRQFGHDNGFSRAQLVLPKPGFFPANGEQGHARALRIFSAVKDHCGMTNWETKLVADNNPLSRPMTLRADAIAPQRYALGTYSTRGGCAQISYVPTLLAHPERLIATFSHELSHYLLATSREPPVCTDDEIECLTDLTAVFMGFGVFLANARFNVETMTDGVMSGWSMGRSGYLPETDLVFALALFLRIKRLDDAQARSCLKPHLSKQLRRAMADLPEDHPDVSHLRTVLAEAETVQPANPVVVSLTLQVPPVLLPRTTDNENGGRYRPPFDPHI
jgi:hypothetical protein